MISSNRIAPHHLLEGLIDHVAAGLMSIHFLSRREIELYDSVTAGLSRDLALATGFPVTMCSALSREMVSDVSVTYLSIPFTIRTEEAIYRNVFDEDRPSHPRPGRFSCSRLFTLLLGMLFHFEAMKTLDMDSSFHLVLIPHQV